MSSKELRQAGLKATHPRRKILAILQTHSDQHLSAEDIHRLLLKNDTAIGLATVYRVLTQFEAAGLVSRNHFEGGHARYELDQGEHHDHVVCISCGLICEFSDPLIEQRQLEIAAKLGFELAAHSLILYGRCANCCSDKQQR